ncbi:MAG: glycosyl transferase family 1 [Synechococcus sp. XM-24]|nr:MAG: glycosyl transferase family 1 [Synechococcus sp. XM-24]
MGYYLLHLHLHGLFRGHDLELGRDADTGGQTTYVLELAKGLAARPEVDRVDVVTRLIQDKRVSADYAQAHEPLADGASIVRFPCGPRRYLRKELLWPYLDEMADAVTAHIAAQPQRPHWIHAHYADAGYVGALVSQRLGIPLVFTGHSLGREKQRRLLEGGLTHEQIEQTYAIGRRIDAEERALAQASLVITSTQQEAQQQYARYNRFEAEQACVVPPGVDAQRFHPVAMPGEASDVEALMEPFLREPNKSPLLTICRAVRRKNVPALVEAYGRSALLQERHNLVLVLGCREDPRSLEKQQRDQFQQIFELVDRFDLYGKVAYPKHHRGEQIPAIYRWAAQRCGIFVNPALTEPFGLTLLEAAACGLPLVSTDDGGPRDILQRCSNGQLADVTDLDVLQQALEEAGADLDRWRSWRDNGIEAISRNFSWDAHVCSYLGEGDRRCTPGVVAASPAQPVKVKAPPVQRLLLLDLDVCLQSAQPAGLEDLRRRLAADPQCGIGMLSGRHFASARLRFAELHLPEPQVWILEAGADLRFGAEGRPDVSWHQHIAQGWQRKRVEQVLEGLSPRLSLQPEVNQGSYKVSYTLEAPTAGVLEMVRQRLRQHRLEARAHLFHHWFLDVLPMRASKADAIRHLCLNWGLPLDQVLVVAAQQGDAELLNGSSLGLVACEHDHSLDQLRRRPKVFFASRPQAWGVLEGLDHYRFLSR